MTDPAAKVPANWGFYLLISVGMSLGMGFLADWLERGVGVSLPSAGISIGVAYASAMWAGSRYLKSVGGIWDREDRKRVALAYTWANVIWTGAALIAVGIAVFLGAGPWVGITPKMMASWPIVLGVGAVVLPLVLLAYYGITRWALAHHVDQFGSRRDVSGEFS